MSRMAVDRYRTAGVNTNSAAAPPRINQRFAHIRGIAKPRRYNPPIAAITPMAIAAADPIMDAMPLAAAIAVAGSITFDMSPCAMPITAAARRIKAGVSIRSAAAPPSIAPTCA